MKEYTTEFIRNVALAGHQGAGKTSLVEAMLFTTGAVTRMGKVTEGNTVSDDALFGTVVVSDKLIRITTAKADQGIFT